MKLVIAEKPTLARDIARAICGKPVSDTARLPISGNGYIVASCYGHLMQLAEPAEIDERWGKPFTLDVLPIAPDPWPVVPAPDKIDAIERIADLLPQAECVIHCGDPDDEGQLIVDEVLDHLGYDGPVQRVYVNDSIEKNILRAFEQAKPNGECRKDGLAARARSIADMCFGVNESRLATIKCGTMLTLGRVQTPTLGLVVARDAAIEGHQMRKFYEIQADGVTEDGVPVAFKLKPSEDARQGEDRIYDEAKAEELRSALEGIEGSFTTRRREKAEKPPLPHDLTSLIAEMSKRHKIGAKATQDATQSLREKHHAITYNRTDSRYLKEEHHAEAETVLACAMANLEADWQLDYALKSAAFNEKRVSAHHAIIPTEIRFDATGLTDVERKVYEAVCIGYARQFLPPAMYDVRESSFMAEGIGELACSQKALISPGWKAAFGSAEKDDAATEMLDPGEHRFRYLSASVKECETKPPAPYTEGTLTLDMANIAKYVADPAIKEILKAKVGEDGNSHGGIGTTATRTAIIENLKARGYIEEANGKIRSTEKGRGFYAIIPPDIKTADVTAAWALIQSEIAEGRAPVTAVMESVVEVFNSHKDTAYANASIAGSGTKVLGTCPLCGKQVVAKGSKQKAVQCESNRFAKDEENGKWERTAGCGFRIFRTIAGKKLTDSQISALLQKGSAGPIKGFKSKAGKSFEAKLKLDEKTGEISFAFDGKPKKTKASPRKDPFQVATGRKAW